MSIVNIYSVFLEDWLTRSCCPVLQGDYNDRSFFYSPTRKSHVSVSCPTTRLSPRYLHPVLHDQHLLSLSILSFNTDVSPGLSILSFKIINTPVMSYLSLVSHQVCIFCPSRILSHQNATKNPLRSFNLSFPSHQVLSFTTISFPRPGVLPTQQEAVYQLEM